MSVFERAYGWAIIVLGYSDTGETLSSPLGTVTGLQEIKAYGPPQITISDSDLESDPNNLRFGQPKYYHIRRADKLQGDVKVHYTRVLHFANRLFSHDWMGQSVLDPIWDDLNVLRNIRWSMGQTMYRYGSGFPDITFTGAELDDINTWIDSGAFQNLNARTYFAHSEDQTMEFKGLAGHALDPMNYYLPPMEHISCGTGIPMNILRGAQAGQLTGSEVNQMEYYGVISDEQSGYEKGIRELIDIIQGLNPDGRRVNPIQYKIKWGGGFELDQEKQQTIATARSQELLNLWNFFNRNEIRRMVDPDATELSKEDGGEDFAGQNALFNQPNNPDKSAENPEVEPVAEGASYKVTLLPNKHKHS